MGKQPESQSLQALLVKQRHSLDEHWTRTREWFVCNRLSGGEALFRKILGASCDKYCGKEGACLVCLGRFRDVLHGLSDWEMVVIANLVVLGAGETLNAADCLRLQEGESEPGQEKSP